MKFLAWFFQALLIMVFAPVWLVIGLVMFCIGIAIAGLFGGVVLLILTVLMLAMFTDDAMKS